MIAEFCDTFVARMHHHGTKGRGQRVTTSPDKFLQELGEGPSLFGVQFSDAKPNQEMTQLKVLPGFKGTLNLMCAFAGLGVTVEPTSASISTSWYFVMLPRERLITPMRPVPLRLFRRAQHYQRRRGGDNSTRRTAPMSPSGTKQTCPMR